MTGISQIARLEYDRRFEKAAAIEKAGDLTHEISDQIHNWERIAWLLDSAGRNPHQASLLIGPDELEEMAATAASIRDIWFEKCRQAPDDKSINFRAADLHAIASELSHRAKSLKRGNVTARAAADIVRNGRRGILPELIKKHMEAA